jgi:hypothetical protein
LSSYGFREGYHGNERFALHPALQLSAGAGTRF